MIEMLGVLAIIGILSAGGIMGYTAAMENYKVNKFVMDAKLYAVEASRIFDAKYPATNTYTDLTEKFYRLGIVPSYPYKSPFGGNLLFQLNEAVADSECILPAEAQRAGLSYYIPAPCKALSVYITEKVPLSTCVKLFTTDWRDSGFLYAGPYIANAHAYYNFPLSPAAAEAACQEHLEKPRGFLTIIVFFKGKKVPL